MCSMRSEAETREYLDALRARARKTVERKSLTPPSNSFERMEAAITLKILDHDIQTLGWVLGEIDQIDDWR